MLEDEARFGRITDPKRCWAPKGIRPLVNKQIIREYTYAYGAVSPLDGISDFIILPSMSADCMNLFLAELADRHPDEFILLISDCAPSHSEGALKIPDNIMIAFLPPYSPELNPVENIWEEVREKSFPNLAFESMDQLEEHLVEALLRLENDPVTVQSIAGFQWIVSSL
jgi:transposase